MNRKELKELGLADDQIEGVMKSYNADIEPLKTKLANATKESDSYKQTVEDRDKQLSDLKKQSGDNKDLQTKIEELQNTNKEEKAKHQSELAGVKKDSAIRLALMNSKAKDPNLLMKSLDTDKISINDEGKLDGLKDQVDSFKKGHEYMFNQGEPKPKNPINAFSGGNPGGSDNEDSLLQKITSRMAGDK